MERIKNYLRWANMTVLFLTFLAYLSPYVSPSIFWPLSFFGLIFPWLLLINFLFVIVWLSAKKRYFLFSLLTIVMGWGYTRSIIGLGINKTDPSVEGSIKLTSFNAHSIVPIKNINTENKKEYQAFSNLIKKENAQVFCFQEVPTFGLAIDKCRKLKENPIDKKYKIIKTTGSLGMLTEFPVLKTETKFFDSKANGYQWADLQWSDNQIIRVFNIHLQSNRISDMAEEVRENGQFNDEKTWRSIKGIMGRYKRASRKRAIQAEEIADAIKKSPHPVVVCGDLNDVPLSYSYRLISEGLQDSFKEKGGGLATTYSGPIPGLRIDYIFVGSLFKITSFYTGKRNFSDHRPVSTIIDPRL